MFLKSYIKQLKRTYDAIRNKIRVARIYRKHGVHTKWHLVDPCFDIGNYTYGVPVLYRYDSTTRLTIGKYCSIASGVRIMLGGNHHIKRVSQFSFYEFPKDFPEHGGWTQYVKGDVKIGNDVWIGRDAMILSGVTIGDGAVVGGGTVIAKDVPPYAIVVGNPGRIVRYRFSPEQIDSLLKIRWWDWPVEKVNMHLRKIQSEDVDAFIAEFCNM